MRNHENRVVVWYPGHGMRVRSCQTTEYPKGYARHTTVDAATHARNFNAWAMYIKAEVSNFSGHGNRQLDEAKRIINKRVTIKK